MEPCVGALPRSFGPGVWGRMLFRASARFFGTLAAAAGAQNAAGADREALNAQAEALLDRFGNSVLRLAYAYLHSMDDAEEVLQDTLLQYIRTAPAFESAEHEKAWLLRVAANLSKNRIRYNRLRDTDELSEELAGEEREDLSFVWEAVRALPEKYREVIHLFYQEGCQTQQIAAILGENEATVRSRLSRGRERLKAVLKEAYDFG
jgi:RNA polymerase sigma factor (sigma-70 family)